MSTRGAIWYLFALLLAAAAVPEMSNASPPSFVKIAAAETQLPEETNKAGGVEIKVTPTIAPGAETWEFALVFDTHTGALTGDPAQFAVLIDSQGATHKPLAWAGDPPGGHHRKGVLRFRAPNQRSGKIVLQLRDVGGVPERVFQWELR